MPNNNNNLNTLSWSDEAENVLSMFYNADMMVYVEGEDDIGFWEIVFKKNKILNVKIQDVGGCENLVPYIERITTGKIKAIVAKDSDLNFFSSDIIEHTNIIYTKGYSIENTMINEKVILRVLKSMGKYKAKDIPLENINLWLNKLYNNVENLIVLDIYNHISKQGLSIVCESCERFMQSKSSLDTCINKINSYIQGLPDNFKEQGLKIKEKLTFSNETNINHWLRGHFFFSASHRFIINYLSKDKKKVSISKDSFYSSILMAFELNFTEEHEDYNYYREKIKLIS